MTGEFKLSESAVRVSKKLCDHLIDEQAKGNVVRPRVALKPELLFYGTAGAAYRHKDGSLTYVRVK